MAVFETQAGSEDTNREELRKKLIGEIPPGYNPYIHLAIPSLFGLAAILAAIYFLKNLNGWELLTIPLTYIFSNGIEWVAHRDLLHKRNPIAPILYAQHVPAHHRVYVTEDMAYRDPIEMKLILVPPYGIMLIALISSPITLALHWLVGQNTAALFAATSVAYVVGYEWLHLSYHLPPDHPVSRWRLIKMLRRHHATHHDPKLMQKWNLNVTVPLWDWILRTRFQSKDPSP